MKYAVKRREDSTDTGTRFLPPINIFPVPTGLA